MRCELFCATRGEHTLTDSGIDVDRSGKRVRWLVFATMLLGACAKEPPDVPRVALTDVGIALHLPAPMQAALDSLAPGFRIVNASTFRSDIAQAASAGSSGALPAAFAAIGDFNHDGTVDVVVEGASPGSAALRVIAILNGAHPSAVEVTRFAEYDVDAVGIYLTTPPAGTSAAFDVVAYPDSTIRYQWANGALQGTNIRP
ncbi:MAG: hypothetical protein M3Z05_21640 [Gemmatimonadota bacterium]|nr:hypothetical protein [Gemmatimonadota bacterium]